MKRLALRLLLMAALVTPAVFLMRSGIRASPDATIIVNSTGDTDARDDVLTLREAMLLATGGLAVADLDLGECAQVSNRTYGPPCSTSDTIGASSPDTIVFDTSEFPPDGSAGVISLVVPLPPLGTGSDAVLGAGAGVTVDGSAMTYPPYYCFEITSAENRIAGLYITRCPAAVLIDAGAQNNTIGGATTGECNSFEGNWVGVEISGSDTSGNVVSRNFFGAWPGPWPYCAPGVAARNGTAVWIHDGASGNTFGGTSGELANLLQGNPTAVHISGSDTQGNLVAGNLVLGGLPGSKGVRIDEGAQHNAVDDNHFDDNGYQIEITSGASANTVEGNELRGGSDDPDGGGIVIAYGASSNVVGGVNPGQGNRIDDHPSGGVILRGSGTVGNSVIGNVISGNGGHGGGSGVTIWMGAQSNLVDSNEIDSNELDGVYVEGWDTTFNSIRHNSIWGNHGMGIDNVGGGNSEVAPPLIDGVGGSVGGHTDPKCYPCTVEVFSDEEDEGRIYHGSTTTNDDATGTWTYTGTVTGPNITATITDASGNTSEFSAPVGLSPTPTPTPTATPPPVGGIAELPDIAAVPLKDSGSSVPNTGVLAGLSAGVALLLMTGAWYATRRWLRHRA